MSAIITVKNLSKQFKNILAVDDLSFSVNEGDVYGFLGQNGAGKSTTIRMLLTLIKPTRGFINVFGKPLDSYRNTILKNVGAVIEKPDLYKYLTAYENLALFAKMSGVKLSKAALTAQLELVDLHTRADSKIKTFSQGMKQRLGIAVALVHNPSLIILDEPTNGLDPQGISEMRHLILQLSKERGKTILVSSHLLSEIELIANRILIINKGKKIIEGDATSLLDPAKTIVQLNTLNNTETKHILNASPWAGFMMAGDEGIIRLQMNKNDIPELSRFLIHKDVAVLSINPRHSLEDYFLSITTNHVEAVTN
jgi:ABC-type multidrug transport system ATPase subunit